MNLRKLWDTVKGREAWHAAVHRVARVGHDLATEPQSKFFFAHTATDRPIGCFMYSMSYYLASVVEN